MKSQLSALVERWRAAGLTPGDTLLLHSDIRRTLRAIKRDVRDVTPTDILETFLAALGPDGTLLLPLFNFAFTTGTPFDIRTTPSQMGALTEAGRVYPGSVRTGHPVYSFAAIGARADRFRGVDNVSAYGADSPFGILRELDGSVAALDLPENDSMTIYHHVEELRRVPYRYVKEFTGGYTDGAGVESTRTYTIYVRDVARGVVTDGTPAGELMWQAGVYRGFRPGVEAGLRTVRANAIFDFLADIIDNGRAQGLLYTVAPPA
jgi:aminoglycoside 3-N-acetyltransferase